MRPASKPFGEFVLKLIEPFNGYGRNIITDNFFTSALLTIKL